jgi:transcription elongation factor Elf1
MGQVEYYNYYCRLCGYKDKVNEAAVFMGISEEPSTLVCPNCGESFEYDKDQNPPEGR